jgi:hypothetical protein
VGKPHVRLHPLLPLSLIACPHCAHFTLFYPLSTYVPGDGVHGDKLVVFGGSDRSAQFFSDTYVLDGEIFEFLKSPLPLPSYVLRCAFPPTIKHLFSCPYIDANHWTKLTHAGLIPPSRSGHSAICYQRKVTLFFNHVLFCVICGQLVYTCSTYHAILNTISSSALLCPSCASLSHLHRYNNLIITGLSFRWTANQSR